MNKFAITALSVLAGMAFTECAAAADASVYDRGAKFQHLIKNLKDL